MLRNLRYAPSFGGLHQEPRLRNRPSPATHLVSWSAVIALRTIYDALGEGLAAYRRYERLRSRGIPHDPAIRAALGTGRSPLRGVRNTTNALCLAGRA